MSQWQPRNEAPLGTYVLWAIRFPSHIVVAEGYMLANNTVCARGLFWDPTEILGWLPFPTPPKEREAK